ncbi:hypothetical protein [Halosimplex salinum]|uniref:hypothetical protein n=1 Tax=Halosimplex salinum TaxID=1710538 RepID=UPI000F463003|nr:hypothetical protein [Halosimplex salinum]
MREYSRGSAAVSAPLASYTLGQVVVAALVAVLVTVGLVAVVAQPALLVAVAVVALAVRARRVVTVPVVRAHRRLTVERRPAVE